MTRLWRIGGELIAIGKRLLGFMGILVFMLFGAIELIDGDAVPVVTAYPSVNGEFTAYTLSVINGPVFSRSCNFSVLLMRANVEVSKFYGRTDFDFPGLDSHGGYEVFSEACNPDFEHDKPPRVVWTEKNELTIFYPGSSGRRQLKGYRVKSRDKSQHVKVITFISSVKE